MTIKKIVKAIDYNIAVTVRGKRLKEIFNYLGVVNVSDGIIFNVKDYPVDDNLIYVIGGSFDRRSYDRNTNTLLVTVNNELPY